jgi:predicted ATP-grasp superfamily ATP-dependent carboligase
VNPRIWGWHTIAFQAGLDLPYLAYKAALGIAVNAETLQKDAKWIRIVTDIPTAISEIAAGRLSFRQYLESISGDLEFAVLSWRDPLPFVADLIFTPINYVRGRGF